MFKKKEIFFKGEVYKLCRLTAYIEPVKRLHDIEEHLISHNAEIIDIRISKCKGIYRRYNYSILFYATGRDISAISAKTDSGIRFIVGLA